MSTSMLGRSMRASTRSATSCRVWGMPATGSSDLILASPQGIERLSTAHPDVDIHVGAIDEGINEIGYIVPGLGDAGDRQFRSDSGFAPGDRAVEHGPPRCRHPCWGDR